MGTPLLEQNVARHYILTSCFLGSQTLAWTLFGLVCSTLGLMGGVSRLEGAGGCSGTGLGDTEVAEGVGEEGEGGGGWRAGR